VRADENGNKAEYYPYGETVSSSVSVPDLFGTYAREASGLDYANQRYYASAYGRFVAPDPSDAGSNLQNPGSLNPYAYVVGDPVNQIDPRGLYACDPDSDPNCLDPGVNPCNWNPYDPSCQWTGGSPSGATSGFLPVAAGVGVLAAGAGETVCIISIVCGTVEGLGAGIVGIVAVVSIVLNNTSHPAVPAVPIPIADGRGKTLTSGWTWNGSPQQIEQECTASGPVITQPATSAQANGGTNNEQMYVCPDGKPYTIQWWETPGGKVKGKHGRPGPPKMGTPGPPIPGPK
jgi:RHS repeat-associated protein